MTQENCYIIRKMDLTSYVRNKVLSVVITVVILSGLTVFFAGEQGYWRTLILCIIFFGQGHFFVGYIYHFSSSRQRALSVKTQVLYGLVLAVSIIALYAYFTVGNIGYLLFILSAHFIMHNMLNEKTMLQRYLGIEVSYVFIWTIIMWSLTFFSLSVSQHQVEFYYAQALLTLDKINQIESLSHLLPKLNTNLITYLLGSCAIGLTIYWLLKEDKTMLQSWLLGVLFFTTLVGCLVSSGLSFIVCLAAIINYHYITWVIFSWDAAETNQARTKVYTTNMGVYGILGCLFFFAHVFDSTTLWSLYIFIFSTKMFMFWTFLHINFNLINESPIRQLFKKIG